jgi:hypothetical protein
VLTNISPSGCLSQQGHPHPRRGRLTPPPAHY